MNVSIREVAEVLWPLLVVVGSVVVGWALEKVVLGRLKALAERTSWRGDDIVLGALNGAMRLWVLLAGIKMALGFWALKPGVEAILGKAIVGGWVLSATLVLARIVSGLVNLYTPKVEGINSSASILVNLARGLVWVLGGLIALQSMGISIAPILTALGVGGLATALALQPTLTNLFSGIQILASRNIKPGDYVRLDSGDEGYVVDITWRHTAIRALPNNLILVPNGRLAAAIVTNYHYPEKELATPVSLGVAYGSDLAKVEAVTLEVARAVQAEVKGAVATHEPVWRLQSFGDSAILFTVGLRACEFSDQGLVKHEFIRRLHARYQAEGIEIPFPQRVVRSAP